MESLWNNETKTYNASEAEIQMRVDAIKKNDHAAITDWLKKEFQEGGGFQAMDCVKKLEDSKEVLLLVHAVATRSEKMLKAMRRCLNYGGGSFSEYPVEQICMAARMGWLEGLKIMDEYNGSRYKGEEDCGKFTAKDKNGMTPYDYARRYCKNAEVVKYVEPSVVRARMLAHRRAQSSSDSCFLGSSVLQMADGKEKAVRDVRVGEEVWCPRTGRGEKIALISRSSGPVDHGMVELRNGLWITPHHPVRLDGAGGEWVYPKDIAHKVVERKEILYNYVLEGGFTFMLNGVECLDLGHNKEVFGERFEEHPCFHPFWGTEKIIERLQGQRA